MERPRQGLLPFGDATEAEPEPVDLKSMSPEDVFLAAHLEKYEVVADDALVRAFREIMLLEEHAS